MTELEHEKELTLQGLAIHVEKQAREEALYQRVEWLEERLAYVEGGLGYVVGEPEPEQDDAAKPLEQTARMYWLLRQAQDGLSYIFQQEPAGLNEDEELSAALEQLLSSLEKWTEPLKRQQEEGRKARHVASLLWGAVNNPVIQDEEIRAAIQLLEQRLPAVDDIPF